MDLRRQVTGGVGFSEASRNRGCRHTFKVIRGRVQISGACPIRGFHVLVSGIDIHAAFTVQWMTQVSEIGASQGMYDHLRKIVVFGPGQYQFQLKNVNSETWGTPVDIQDLPPRLLIPFDQRPGPVPGMPWTEMSLGMIKNMPQSDPKDASEIDSLIASREIRDRETSR
jgi:hypothetical protein